MHRSVRIIAVALLAAVTVAGTTTDAQAQRAGRVPSSRPSIEFSTTYGSMWGGNIPLTYGKLRTATGDSWGFALDYPLQPNTWVELGYNRQSGALDWDPNRASKVTLTDMSVNHWHIGGLRGFGRPDAAVMPFVVSGLGLTYYSPEASQVTIDSDDYFIDGATKFALNFGAGFKAYFGEARRVGIRGSFRVFATLYDAGGGFYFGTGGASLGVGGSAIFQYEAAGGLTVKFGG
jgi:hypothetical protein